MHTTIDATNKKLGRLASEIAVILQNKRSVMYNPRLAGSDTVLIKNADKMSITEAKKTKKVYHRHTGYMGHIKSLTLKQMLEKSPAKALRLAVYRMLPKNFLRDRRMKRLIIEE